MRFFNNLPRRNINVGAQNVYFLYTNVYPKNIETVIEYLGDSVILLKPVIAPYRKITTEGTMGLRGKYGSRRDVKPVRVENQKPYKGLDINDPKRLEFEDSDIFRIPALVDMSPPPETRRMFGYKPEDSGVVIMSANFLRANNIDINVARDYLEYRGTRYKLRSVEPVGSFLDSFAGFSFIIRRS